MVTTVIVMDTQTVFTHCQSARLMNMADLPGTPRHAHLHWLQPLVVVHME